MDHDRADRLVHIVDDVEPLEAPVLVLALEGFLDAGRASVLAAEHLLADRGPVVATFDVDELYDYRARRPPVSFVRDRYEDYAAPRLVVRRQRDAEGTPYLLLVGPEPDVRWEAFARAVRVLVERLGVSRVVALAAVPMAVPHTRPVALTVHANEADLVTGPSPWQGELRVPSSAQAMLEIRLGEWGHPMQGAVVHVPHYLAQMGYPRAAISLLEHVAQAASLSFDLTTLRADAERTDAEIADYLTEHGEVLEVVQGLERQYDTFHRAEEQGSNLLAPEEPLPSGEEIGRQFEQFLAGLEGPDVPDDRT
ncbi:PAC2 family protein [Nocardioides sp. ChNu-153]|uniref:PAC2 family protein n=1 Tax=unclassified Nocardioides TaxID=2615069 RepID=UPI0024069C17|nr:MULTISPECIES: PAC2 family protein [unclassified Nocardioides]MDF9715375.1 PAC2 family protein [Nocardioides sp. ChNu-99]MDN7121780.1 PAC2 family protein [Nocardioides sp. ChNu-153]